MYHDTSFLIALIYNYGIALGDDAVKLLCNAEGEVYAAVRTAAAVDAAAERAPPGRVVQADTAVKRHPVGYGTFIALPL